MGNAEECFWAFCAFFSSLVNLVFVGTECPVDPLRLKRCPKAENRFFFSGTPEVDARCGCGLGGIGAPGGGC